MAYSSRQLKNHERNYPTHDMELVTIYTISSFRCFKTIKV